ncbi:protein FAR1-RELATED SEQUENCE 11-like [Primulina eburnea]|uniref:protein FAR1-RELATED SEQUENCE 11-like n=1 Tax=Primulina eburnea TaxID=1245227 RepID=UPI003C6C4C4F
MPEQTNIIKETSENGSESSPDDNGTIEEMPEDTILSQQTSVNLLPFIGQRFVSQDAAYEFYSSFAKQCGFSIRRHRTRGKDGVGRGITRRDFTCHRGGYPQIKPTADLKLQRNRKSSRCGCQAYMRIVKRADFDVPEWRVTGFSNIHNHELLKFNEMQLLPLYCKMTADDKSRICMYAKAGMSVRQMLRLMELEKGIKLGCLPFSEIDVRNLLQSFRNVDQDNDPIDLLTMCKMKKDRDSNFKYNYKIDANHRLEHIAWSYSSSIKLYEVFGDVVVLDTTHRVDAYDMLLGIWIGVDNHGTYRLFGCTLLRDENAQSFSWGLKAFLDFMNGKAPVTILTDQNTWLKQALAMEMSATKQCFSIWHITSKFSDWFSVVLGSQYDNWKSEFHQLYNLHEVQEFEVGWREMMDTYGLHGNKHIVSLYALRAYWALPFLRSYFFAGMSSTFKSEMINSYIQRFLSAQSAPDNFVEQVALVLDARDQIGSKSKIQPKVPQVYLKTGSPIESHVATILTPYAFCKLQEELVSAPQYATMLVDQSYFIVRHHTEVDGGCKVLWVPHDEFISCTCRHYEFSGILCRHVLRVLSTSNCFRIPDQYLPLRWRHSSSTESAPSSSTKAQLLQSMISSLISESIKTEDRLDDACAHISLVLARVKQFPAAADGDDDIAYNSPSDSLILAEVEDSDSISQSFNGNSCESLAFAGWKERKSRDELDMYIKRRRFPAPCGGQYGHVVGNCPILGNDDLNGDGPGFM